MTATSWELGLPPEQPVTLSEVDARTGVPSSRLRDWASRDGWKCAGWTRTAKGQQARLYTWRTVAVGLERRKRLPEVMRSLLPVEPVPVPVTRPLSHLDAGASSSSRPRSWRDSLTAEQLELTVCPQCHESLPAYVVADHLGLGPRTRPLDPDPNVPDPGDEDGPRNVWASLDVMRVSF